MLQKCFFHKQMRGICRGRDRTRQTKMTLAKGQELKGRGENGRVL